MVKALKRFGRHLGLEDVSRITGHSMRTTGAQQLALAGFSTEQIKAFGRWKGSEQMPKYARETVIAETAMKQTMNSANKSASSNTSMVTAISARGSSKASVGPERWTKLSGHRS